MAEAAKKDERMVKATVARRRTVVLGTTTSEGEKRKRVEFHAHPPGAEVTLPASEAKRLTELGFLVDPSAAPVPVAAGPSFQGEQTTITPG